MLPGVEGAQILLSAALQLAYQLAGVERLVAQHMIDCAAHELLGLLLRDRVGEIARGHVKQRFAVQL